MLIAFVHTGNAFLPGIAAYSDYFSRLKVNTVSVLRKNLNDINPDVEWHFMGVHLNKRKPGRIIIHEYASASTPPFANLKNIAKKWTMPIRDWKSALNQFSIIFEGRMPVL